MKAQVSHDIPRCVLFANSKQFKGDTTEIQLMNISSSNTGIRDYTRTMALALASFGREWL